MIMVVSISMLFITPVNVVLKSKAQGQASVYKFRPLTILDFIRYLFTRFSKSAASSQC